MVVELAVELLPIIWWCNIEGRTREDVMPSLIPWAHDWYMCVIKDFIENFGRVFSILLLIP